jgi:hypothetical protein
MQRIEGGEVGVSATDLRALLDIYGITDEDRIRSLTVEAHAARQQRYVTPPDYREHLTPGLVELMQFEAEAVSIRAYQPVSYPGVLQTPAVAEAMIFRWISDDEKRRVRFEARMARRKQNIERRDGPEYLLILDESVIKRRFAGKKATAEQLEEIADLVRRPKIHIRVVPLAQGAEAVAMGAFQIVSLASGESLLYIENYKADRVVHDMDEIEEYRAAFEEFWGASLDEDATLRALVAEAATLRAALDQRTD